jgi:hypothetical protein
LPHRPARSVEDSLALGQDDPGSRALWEVHRRRAQAAVERLKLAAPRPNMAGHDRLALRGAALVLLFASIFVAGPELGTRLRSAFDWRAPAPPAPALRVDGWIDPPLYTRTPPLMIDLAAGEQHLRAPVKSTLVIRVAGKGEVTVAPGRGLAPLPASENQRPDLREQRFTITGHADLSVRSGVAGGVRLHVEAIPDHPPEIAFANPPELNVRGTFNLTYKAKDDYGIASVEGVIEKGNGFIGRRALVPAPRIALALPPDARGETDTKSTVDLTQHPWAGARIKLSLLARPAATAVHEAARPRARRAAPHPRARPGRPQARAGRARCAAHRARAVHAAMGRVHGAAGRGEPASRRQDGRRSRRRRGLALGDGAADRGRRPIGRRA